jgi:hypothetical protein
MKGRVAGQYEREWSGVWLNHFAPMHPRLALASLTILAAIFAALPTAGADEGDQRTPVQVTLPEGMTSTTLEVRPGPTATTKYLIIHELRVTNQSQLQPLNVDFKDFVLRDYFNYDDAIHVDSKFTNSLPDSLSEGSLGPGQRSVGALAFLVPATMRKASLWYYVYQFDATYPTY